MAISEKQLIAELKAGNYKPVYFISGEVNYYIDMISDYFEQQFIAEEYRDFDQTVVYGHETTMLDVLSMAQRFPMMSPVQLVLVKEAQNIDAKQWDALEKYLQNPQPQTVLVFCYRHKSFDKRTKVYKAIDKNGVYYEHGRMYDNQVPEWIANFVKERGYQITQRAATLIAQYLGTDLAKIANEVSKVFISLQQGGTIDISEVEQNIGISKNFNDFELVKAIGNKDVLLCNRIVNYYSANPKDNPLQRTLENLYSFVIKTMLYHQAPDKTPNAVAKVIGVNPFFVGDYSKAASNLSLGKLASCIGYLYETDLRSKGIRNSGSVTEGELLKELVFKMIH